MLYWCITVRIYTFIMALHSSITVIKLTRPFYITKLSMTTKKEGLQFSKFIMKLINMKLVLIQVSCLIFAIYTKIVRLDYTKISVFSKQYPILCYIIPIFLGRWNLGSVVSSLPIIMNVHSVFRKYKEERKHRILLNFCEVKPERRSLTLLKKFQIIKRHFSAETKEFGLPKTHKFFKPPHHRPREKLKNEVPIEVLILRFPPCQ